MARTSAWISWAARAVAGLALAVVAWALLTAWGGVWHSHPAYAVLLLLTVLGALAALTVSILRSRPGTARRAPTWLRIVGIVLGAAWVIAIAWLRPFSAIEPALTAMESDAEVTATETATTIVLEPADASGMSALAFQPGARVDPRAYAAVLRPLAEAGHPVVIVKQPLGIGFLALDGLDVARSTGVDADVWALGGHSLGGTVAALEALAEGVDDDLRGLVLFASYPAGDMKDFAGEVTSISGSQDGLSTPAKIEASRADLPATASFVVVEGASHAQFGDYGPQPGDGVGTLSDDEARDQIAAAALEFMDFLTPLP
ncbi:alpha/beta hydrolase [Demequina sp. NBRC 110052]|uniref:alpha/beta hydrolase n=1 Tax=Demequina sp. NBRC 110052 TaxID=1570341 RepID=UPI0009FC01F0|nr:alpha/beta hydrolase [Demequina sp. NBRC 110052]